MAEVDITVDCQISGQRFDFVYDTDNTLNELIKDLQHEGLAWRIGHQPQDAGIFIDGNAHLFWPKTPKHPFSLVKDKQVGTTLHELGVKSGSVVIISGGGVYCGPGQLPIVFYCTEWIDSPSPNWGMSLNWINGDSLTGFRYGSGCIWNVLPKNVDRKAVYVTLHGYRKNGQMKTFLENQSLEQVDEVTFQEHGSVDGWICFVFSKSQRRRLGS
jgi:hypothetical protein